MDINVNESDSLFHYSSYPWFICQKSCCVIVISLYVQLSGRLCATQRPNCTGSKWGAVTKALKRATNLTGTSLPTFCRRFQFGWVLWLQHRSLLKHYDCHVVYMCCLQSLIICLYIFHSRKKVAKERFKRRMERLRRHHDECTSRHSPKVMHFSHINIMLSFQ